MAIDASPSLTPGYISWPARDAGGVGSARPESYLGRGATQSIDLPRGTDIAGSDVGRPVICRPRSRIRIQRERPLLGVTGERRQG
jgi:hypothetical protein